MTSERVWREVPGADRGAPVRQRRGREAAAGQPGLAALQREAAEGPSVQGVQALQRMADDRALQRASLEEEEPLQGRFEAQPAVLQRVRVGQIEVSPSGGMPTWEQGGQTYHLNLTTATFHVTREGNPKIHYFYEGYGEGITDKQPTQGERGSKKKDRDRKKVKTSTVFSALPQNVQDFIRTHYAELLQV
ncbi:MAG: hypothetical protein KDK03_10255 [Rhodobacteraceae bacterium]|nr:hypothetical protein [Paracoccaceae bacterium]